VIGCTAALDAEPFPGGWVPSEFTVLHKPVGAVEQKRRAKTSEKLLLRTTAGFAPTRKLLAMLSGGCFSAAAADAAGANQFCVFVNRTMG
jgi:hypothetical protein